MAPDALLPAVDLRPLATSELIDRGFSLYRQNFAGLLLIALLSQAAPLLAQVVTGTLRLLPTANHLATESSHALADAGLYLAIMLTALLMSFLFGVAMTAYVADAYLGRVPSLASSFRRLGRFLAGSIWTCALNFVLYGVTFLFPVLALVVAGAWDHASPPVNFPEFILFVTVAAALFIVSLAPLLIVFMRLMVTAPVIAVEGITGWTACRRSSALVRHDPGLGFFYWGETRLSLLLLPLFVIQMLASTLTSVPLIISQINEAVRHGSAQFANQADVVVVASQIMTYVADALILPLYVIAVTLFYYDVRIRREGFDLEFLAGRLEEKP
jgi:membrane-anchored glycerophosphoryl diester phosphodiesterase (GDPDase)